MDKAPDYVFILVSAGQPQMQSHPHDGFGSPPEFIKQSLGWVSEKEGFGIRLFQARKTKNIFKDSGREVLVYDECIPNPTLCYRALDYSYFSNGQWETPMERNIKAIFVE